MFKPQLSLSSIASLIYGYYGKLVTSMSSMTSVNLHLVNFCLLVLFIIVNFVKWAVFGKLTTNEIRNLKDKISYTVWEFVFGFIIFCHNNDSSKLTLQDELVKFGGLFLCVMLLKCFHYLSVDRAFTIFYHDDDSNISTKLPFLRFAIGLILLNFIDALLIYKFFHEFVYKDFSIGNNILVAIFGFEILNILPLIILTSVKYGLNYYEYWRFDGMLNDDFYKDSTVTKWKEFKLNISYLSEFIVNLVRFIMTCIISIIFLYLYTFPLHILPSSYLSLRVLVIKTRCLVNLKKRQFKLKKLAIPSHLDGDEKCIVCFDYLVDDSSDIRVLTNCNHCFHYGCLKAWVDYSTCCPICRESI